jgi:IPT/TIG domain
MKKRKGTKSLWPRSFWIGAGAAILALSAAGCGGGGGGGSNPFGSGGAAPTITALSPSSAVAGQTGFTLTVTGTNFSASSLVRWNGSNRTTTFVSATELTAQIVAADIANAGMFQITVAQPGTRGAVSTAISFTVTAPNAITITTTSLPPSMAGNNYYFVLAASGGVPPLTWSISAGALPQGLTIDPATGLISGTASGSGPFDFTVRLTDSATAPNTASRALTITLASSLARNDNITACGGSDTPTAISNGTLRASISPYGDVDTYSFILSRTASNLSAETFAQRLDIGNNLITRSDFLDTVLELLDSRCSVLGLNDDILVSTNSSVPSTQDSKLVVGPNPFPPSPVCTGQLALGAPCSDVTPPASLGPGTYYLRVRDYRGDGRPDLVYDLTVTGIE